MTQKKNAAKSGAKDALSKVKESSRSPQQELLEKSRNNPGLGRKPAGKDEQLKTTPEKETKKSKSTATEKLGSTTVRVKAKMPKHKTLDTSGQDRDL